MNVPERDSHIAPCGLFCSNCKKFQNGKCPGCQVQAGFSRCEIRACCQERKLTTCAQCQDFRAPRAYTECRKVNNPIGRVFGLIFGTNRPAALALLRDQGLDAYFITKRAAKKM